VTQIFCEKYPITVDVRWHQEKDCKYLFIGLPWAIPVDTVVLTQLQQPHYFAQAGKMANTQNGNAA
jgi:hypothetical protein